MVNEMLKIWFNGMDLIVLGIAALCGLVLLVALGLEKLKEKFKRK